MLLRSYGRRPNYLCEIPIALCDREVNRFLRLVIGSVSNAPLSSVLKCNCYDHRLTKKYVPKLQGKVLSLAYFHGRQRSESEKFSGIFLALCKSVKGPDESEASPEESLEMQFALVVEPEVSRDFRPQPNDVICLFPITSLTPHDRSMKAIGKAEVLPTSMHRILFGNKFPAGERVEYICTRSTLRRRIEPPHDPGSALYVQRLVSSRFLNARQHASLDTFLANIGSMRKDSFSVSLITGPHGTGKGTVIRTLIGAAHSHSICGAFASGFSQTNMLGMKDGLIRRGGNPRSLKILVCAPSNDALDHLLATVDKTGIHTGRGSILRPQMI